LPNLDIDFAQVFIAFLVLLFSLTVHEAAHAWTADRLGDPTARTLGRVSLNPAVHVDPIGTILFPLIAMISRVPLIGWAKPVPVNILHLRGNWRQKFMLIAAAGPASNLVLAVIGIALFKAAFYDAGVVAFILLRLIELNVLLAVFNMLPVPPLDGGNVLAGLLRGSAADAFDRLRPFGFIILYGLMFTGVLTAIIRPIDAWLVSLLFD
jgi:Zn-dependent protease